jgi:hypothetical protein
VLTAKNAAGKPEYTPQEQQRFRAWTQGQVESRRMAGQMTAAGGGLLFLGSLYPPIALTPVGHGLRVAATAATFGAAGMEMPDLLTMHAAAQAQRGGSGEFTAQSPNEAQFNLMMGRVNLMLAAGDVLVETGALPAMLLGMKRLAARGVQVSRETWSAGMKAKQAGTFDQWLLGLPADQRQEMRAALEGVPTQRMEARTGNTTGQQTPGTGGTTTPATTTPQGQIPQPPAPGSTRALTPGQANALGGQNRGLIFVQENLGTPRSPAGRTARDFESGTTGAYSDLASQQRVTPALRFDNPNPRGNNYVKFDGIEGNTLIDSKTRLLTFDSRGRRVIPQRDDIMRISEAARQNPQFRVVFEFPNAEAQREARQILLELGIDNIRTRVRQ